MKRLALVFNYLFDKNDHIVTRFKQPYYSLLLFTVLFWDFFIHAINVFNKAEVIGILNLIVVSMAIISVFFIAEYARLMVKGWILIQVLGSLVFIGVKLLRILLNRDAQMDWVNVLFNLVIIVVSIFLYRNWDKYVLEK